MKMFYADGAAYPQTQISTDDFGMEVMAVGTFHDDPAFDDMEQIVISDGTWWHLFAMDQSIRAERESCAV